MAAESKPKPAQGKKPADGAARVMRSEDWSAAPGRGLAAFSYASFRVPGRTGASEAPSEDDGKAALVAKLKEAETRAQQSLAAERKAREEGEARRHAEGLEEGRRQGEAAAKARFDKAMEELKGEVQGALSSLSEAKAAAFLEFEAEAAGILSFALRRVFGSLADGFPEAVLPLIQEAIRALGKSAAVTVKVHPDDHRTASENRSFWQSLDADGDVRCVADPRVPRGGCLVAADSTAARIDLESLGNRLAEAVQAACAEKRRVSPDSASGPAPGENGMAATV